MLGPQSSDNAPLYMCAEKTSNTGEERKSKAFRGSNTAHTNTSEGRGRGGARGGNPSRLRYSLLGYGAGTPAD